MATRKRDNTIKVSPESDVTTKVLYADYECKDVPDWDKEAGLGGHVDRHVQRWSIETRDPIYGFMSTENIKNRRIPKGGKGTSPVAAPNVDVVNRRG